jgi:hypothetical protein
MNMIQYFITKLFMRFTALIIISLFIMGVPLKSAHSQTSFNATHSYQLQNYHFYTECSLKILAKSYISW